MADYTYSIDNAIYKWMDDAFNSGAGQRSQILYAGKFYHDNPNEFLKQHLDEVIANYVYNYQRYGAEDPQTKNALIDAQGSVDLARNLNLDNELIKTQVNDGSQLGQSYYTTWLGSTQDSGFGLGSILGTFGDIFKDLGPLGVVLGNMAYPGLGSTLGVITAIDEGNLGGAVTSLATGSLLNSLGLADTITEATGSETLGQLGTGTVGGLIAGQDLETALTNAAINSGINQVAGTLTNQTPEDFANDVNQVLDMPAEVPVSAFENDINQVLDMPATQTPDIFVDTTAPELPSGMDLASDVTPGTANTIEDIVQALAGEGTAVSGQDLSSDTTQGAANTLEDVSQAMAGEGTAISGQDLAADATPGNTLEDVATVLTPTTTPTEEKPGLTKEQLAQLIKTGLGLFGGVTAGAKALQGLTGSSGTAAPITPTSPIPAFTGTYSGMNPYNADYFQQVQQNYNRLFPSTPANVASPLESWYQTKFVPDTTVSQKLFGV